LVFTTSAKDTSLLWHGAEIIEHAPRLRRDIAVDDGAGCGVGWNLT